MIVIFLGGIGRQLKENLFLQIIPGCVCKDPVGTFKVTDNRQVTGEYINILIQIGIKYRLSK